MRNASEQLAALSVVALIAGAGVARASFTETYDTGTDTGLWLCSNGQPRVIQDSGGNPGKYLQQGGFSTAIPTWASASPRYQPGVNDTFKVDSVYTGNWTAAGVTTFSVDLNVLHAASWSTPGRPVTFQLMQMDDTGFGVNYTAYYTTPEMPTPPVGWTHFDFTVNAAGGAVPAGWVFEHGDGTAGTDAEWGTFLSRIDITELGFWEHGMFYTSLGTWTLGIDNI